MRSRRRSPRRLVCGFVLGVALASAATLVGEGFRVEHAVQAGRHEVRMADARSACVTTSAAMMQRGASDRVD
jgi:hypothetical protein